MKDDGSPEITNLLIDWSKGDEYALEQLMPLVYDELRLMARRYMSRQPSEHTFQPTELIHETYLKIAGNKEQNWQNREHFFGVAATAMRHILVDYAKAKNRQKRGGWQERVTFAEDIAMTAFRPEEMIALDVALTRLTNFGERKAQIVEMKFFGGLKTEEIAEVLQISPKTVNRDWKFARSWLLRALRHTA